jgi:pyrroloquinoline quinone (PQQ) biosynthesis protein C
MVVSAIKENIEKNSRRISESNPLLVKAREGTLTQEQFVTYLYNLLYLFQHTPIHLENAKRRCAELGLDTLREFMEEKIGEEHGHDQWAINDLKKQAIPAREVDHSRIVPSTRRLIEYAKDMIEEDPTLFLSYMAFSEYFTVLVAPEFLNNLKEKCGITREMITSIAYHEELDKNHVQDDLEIIGKVVKSQEQSVDMIRSLEGSMKLVEGFLKECGEWQSPSMH